VFFGSKKEKSTSEIRFFEIPMRFLEARRRKVHRKSGFLKSRCVLGKQEGKMRIGNQGF
jgi:hypothetical protein